MLGQNQINELYLSDKQCLDNNYAKSKTTHAVSPVIVKTTSSSR